MDFRTAVQTLCRQGALRAQDLERLSQIDDSAPMAVEEIREAIESANRVLDLALHTHHVGDGTTETPGEGLPGVLRRLGVPEEFMGDPSAASRMIAEVYNVALDQVSAAQGALGLSAFGAPRELGLSEMPPHAGGGLQDQRAPQMFDHGAGLTHLVGDDGFPVCGWRHDGSTSISVSYTASPERVTCPGCRRPTMEAQPAERPIRLVRGDVAFAHAAGLTAASRKAKVFKIPFAGQSSCDLDVPPIVDLEMVLTNVLFEEGDPLKVKTLLEEGDAFDVIDADEQWRTCLVTQYDAIHECQGGGVIVRRMRCVATQLRRTGYGKPTLSNPHGITEAELGEREGR